MNTIGELECYHCRMLIYLNIWNVSLKFQLFGMYSIATPSFWKEVLVPACAANVCADAM